VLKQVVNIVTIRLKSFTAVAMVPFTRAQGIFLSILVSLLLGPLWETEKRKR
jgi:hypothetical protein